MFKVVWSIEAWPVLLARLVGRRRCVGGEEVKADDCVWCRVVTIEYSGDQMETSELGSAVLSHLHPHTAHTQHVDRLSTILWFIRPPVLLCSSRSHDDRDCNLCHWSLAWLDPAPAAHCHSPTLYFCATRNYQQQSQLWFEGHFLQLSYLFLCAKLAI